MLRQTGLLRRGVIALAMATLTLRCASVRPPATQLAPLPHAGAGYLRGTSEGTAERVIVFVHGLFGSAATTWRNDKTGAYFPELLLDDQTFDGVDVWVHDYPSPRMSPGYTIDELADHLRRHLDDDNVIRNHREVVFVSHSMGGLIVRAYLLKHRDELSPSQVPLLYFFATPTLGADKGLATFMTFMSRNASLSEVRPLRADQPSTIGIYDSQWNNSGSHRSIRSSCAYEKVETYGLFVVQRGSAEHLCNGSIDGILANHIDIVKPADRDGESYIAFRAAYRHAIEDYAKVHGRLKQLWNTYPRSAPLVRLSRERSSPNCRECWSQQVHLEPDARAFVAIHYENDNGRTAHDVRVRLEVPSGIMSSDLVYAALQSDDMRGPETAACVTSPSGPLRFVPLNAWWYQDGAESPAPLPDGQPATAITSFDGVSLGDVGAEAGRRGDVVVEFRAVPIRLVAVRNAAAVIDAGTAVIAQTGDGIDILELVRRIDPTLLHVTPGEIEVSGTQRPIGWVSPLRDLKAGEQIGMCAFLYNQNVDSAGQTRLTLTAPSPNELSQRLELALTTDGVRTHVAAAPISFAKGASKLTFKRAVSLPADLCQVGGPMSAVFQKQLQGNPFREGLELGEMRPYTGTMVVALFDVK